MSHPLQKTHSSQSDGAHLTHKAQLKQPPGAPAQHVKEAMMTFGWFILDPNKLQVTNLLRTVNTPLKRSSRDLWKDPSEQGNVFSLKPRRLSQRNGRRKGDLSQSPPESVGDVENENTDRQLSSFQKTKPKRGKKKKQCRRPGVILDSMLVFFKWKRHER